MNLTNRTLIFKQTLSDRILKILFSLIFLILTSKIKILLPFSLVPITGQTFGIFLISILFGKDSLFSIFLFIVMGVLGIPVFANNHTISVFSSTYGYIVGFFISSFLIVNLKESFKNNLLLLLIFCNFLIYFTGTLYLFLFFSFVLSKSVNFLTLLYVGIIPFIPGDLLKNLLIISFLDIKRKIVWREDAGYKN